MASRQSRPPSVGGVRPGQQHTSAAAGSSAAGSGSGLGAGAGAGSAAGRSVPHHRSVGSEGGGSGGGVGAAAAAAAAAAAVASTGLLGSMEEKAVQQEMSNFVNNLQQFVIDRLLMNAWVTLERVRQWGRLACML